MNRRLDASGPLHLNGVVLPDGKKRDLFIKDGRITFTPVENATTVFSGGYLIPGLVDSHAHLGLNSPARGRASDVERARASAKAHVDAGVLVVREPGGPNRDSRGIGPHLGLPRTFTGGQFLAPPGRYFPGLAREVSEDELPGAAEDEAKASGAWAKVIGDFPGRSGHMELNYRAETLAEAVRRVHLAGGRAAIHVMGGDAVEAAVMAGFDSIEHGAGVREEHIKQMKARGTAWVPTMMVIAAVSGSDEMMEQIGLSTAGIKRTREESAKHPEMVRFASEAGVTILAGTDAGMMPHGVVREEMRLLLDAGLSREDALGAASWTARRYLGLPGIEEGAPADFVGFPDDPRGDPDVLAHPALRILDGRVMADSRRPAPRHQHGST